MPAATDIAKVFKAYDVRALYPEPLNEDIAWRIGFAFAQYLKDLNGVDKGTALVSRDHRPAAPSMCEALVAGIRGNGLDVVDLGKADTSFMYFAIPYLNKANDGIAVLGGVQTTASHNPIQYIGFKISGDRATPGCSRSRRSPSR